jgi:hypothetical protein
VPWARPTSSRARIDRLERSSTAEAGLDAPAERQSKPLDPEARDRAPSGRPRGEEAGRLPPLAQVRRGPPRAPRRGDRAAAEYRDTIISTDAKGGYLITPTQISQTSSA